MDGVQSPLRLAAKLLASGATAGDELTDTMWASGGCRLRDQAGRSCRYHRAQWSREKYPTESPIAHHRADHWFCRDSRPRGFTAGGGYRLSRRAERKREHLPQRGYPRHEDGWKSSENSTKSWTLRKWKNSSTRQSSTTQAGCIFALPLLWLPTWNQRC